MNSRTLLILGLGTGCLAGGCGSDAPPIPEGRVLVQRHDWRVAHTSSDAFQRIAGIRELQSGAVLVLDDLAPTAVLLDSLLQMVRYIGKVGQGPGEFERPVRIIGLPGERTLILDLVPGLGVLIDQHGRSRTAGNLSDVLGCAEVDEETWIHSIRIIGADTLGNLYVADDRFEAADRGRRGSGRTTLALISPACQRVPLGVLQSTYEGSEPRVRPATDAPFEATRSLAVLPSGGLLAVHANPFSMELFAGPDEDPVHFGLTYEPVPLSEAHKSWWRSEFVEPASGVVMKRDGFRSGQVFRPSYRDPSKWPSVLPPILAGALSVDRSGVAWLRRTGADLREQHFDIIASAGEVLDTVAIPRGSRLVGHGIGVLYTALVDPDGFEYLERRRSDRAETLRRQPE